MASGFSDGPPGAGAPSGHASPAVERFQSCRWRKPAEEGTPEHCGHRDVLPMAGTTGFAPDAWCLDCAYYKARRTPRKRATEPPRDDWRW
ncbi:MAG: hypothetical protein AB1635_18405 [Acidobacteriota bacterium]